MIEKNWQELIRPINPEIEPGRDPARKALIIAEPLERGFGMTLGNALAPRSAVVPSGRSCFRCSN